MDITDQSGKLFEVTVTVSNIHVLLKEMNRTELCEQDLIEDESILLALSSVNVRVNFNPKDKHTKTIVIINVID